MIKRYERLMSEACRDARGFQFHICAALETSDIHSAVCLFAMGGNTYSGYAIQTSNGLLAQGTGFCAILDNAGLLGSFTKVCGPLLKQQRNHEFWFENNKQPIQDSEYMVYVCARELISRWVDFQHCGRLTVSGKGTPFLKKKSEQFKGYTSGRFNSQIMGQIANSLPGAKCECFLRDSKCCGGDYNGLSKM